MKWGEIAQTSPTTDGFGNGDGSGRGIGFGDGEGGGIGHSYRYTPGYGGGVYLGRGFGNGRGEGHNTYDGDSRGVCCSDNEANLLAGDSFCLVRIDGKPVVYINSFPVHIIAVKHGVAKVVLYSTRRFEARSGYIAKYHEYVAYGKTTREAYSDARAMYANSLPASERIAAVLDEYPDIDRSIPAARLIELHGELTGSCASCRWAFAKQHGIDLENENLTMCEFLDRVKDEFGGDVIHRLIYEYAQISERSEGEKE